MSGRVFYLARLVPDYRIPVLEELNRALGGSLVACYGEGPGHSSLNTLTGAASSYQRIHVKNSWIDDERILFQRLDEVRARLTPGDVVLIEESPRTVNLAPFVYYCKRKGIGTVLWGHFTSNDRVPSSMHPYDRYRRWLARQVDACACYTEEIREVLARHVNPGRLFVATNTLHAEELIERRRRLDREGLSSVRERLGIPTSDLVLSFVGRLTRDKGVSLLAHTARELAKFRPVTLIVVGDGPERSVLDRSLDDGNVNLVCPGATSDLDTVAPYVYASDTMLLAGRAGLSINMALLLGRPVVLVPSPGRQRFHGPEASFVLPGSNGEIATASTPDALAASVLQVVSDWSRYAVAARSFGESHLLMQDMVSGLLDAIDYARRRGSHGTQT